MTSAYADWNPLGSEFYRRIELYPMNWIDDGIDLTKFKIYPAPNAGNIAVWPITKNDKIIKTFAGANQNPKSLVFIFTACGDYLASIKLKSDHVAQIGWSHKEDLIIIGEHGSVYIYSIFGELQRFFRFFEDNERLKILDCQLYTQEACTSIAVITETGKFYVLQDIDNPIARQYYEVSKNDNSFQCWTLYYSKAGEVQVLLAKDSDLYLVSQFKCEQLSIPCSTVSNILEISLTRDGKNIALYLETGILWLGTFDAPQLNRLCEFLTKSGEKPDSMTWCGSEAICSLWNMANILLLIGLEKDWMNYYNGGPVHLVSEIDGIRVISKDSTELIQKVPAEHVQIYKAGSIAPGAILKDASIEFERQNHKAYEYMRVLNEKGEIKLAVKECIMAATHEFQVSNQKMLLRAASYGKSYVPDFNAINFAAVCQNLRVLNALKDKAVAMPMTYDQLEYLGIYKIIDRLVLRRHYYLAIKLAKYLKIKEELGVARILRNWAFHKIKNRDQTDDEIGQDIIKKIDPTSGVSFAEIAEQAVKEKRMDLAVMLLNKEYKSSQQVPLLLELKQNEQALKKAIESGNSDLVHMVIHSLSQENRRDFFSLLRRYPDAYLLHKKHLEEVSVDKLFEIYLKDGDYTAGGYGKIYESIKKESILERKRCLLEAREYFRRVKNEFVAASVEDQLKLLENQEKLEDKCKKPFIGLSLQDTIKNLLKEKEEKLAESLRKDFKVPERRYWWLKIDVCAEQKDWHELEKFSKLKKSPIGYEPFVNVCLKYKNRNEAQRYAPRVRDEYKINYYVKTGLLEEAAKYAFTTKNLPALDFVAKKCSAGDRLVIDMIANMKKQLV